MLKCHAHLYCSLSLSPNLELFRNTKPAHIREAAIRKTEQFLQPNPSILPDLTNSLSPLGLKSRNAVHGALSAVDKAKEQLEAMAQRDTALQTKLASMEKSTYTLFQHHRTHLPVYSIRRASIWLTTSIGAKWR